MAGEGEELGSGTTGRTATVDELMNGAEYIESLKDGGDIYIYGEEVDDVTTHPAFRNAVLSTKRLYDAFHDPATRDTITNVEVIQTRVGRDRKRVRGPPRAVRAELLRQPAPDPHRRTPVLEGPR